MKKFLLFLILAALIVFGGICGGNALADDIGSGLELPEIFIKAVNPGYTVDGKQNVGEMIEIGRNSSEKMTSLAGLTVGYINSSGNTVTLAEFSKHVFMAGETILLQLASSPTSELAHVAYSKTLAFKAGPLFLMRDGEILDSVCWTGKDGCLTPFSSSTPTSLVRNLETREFEHVANYKPEYIPESFYVESEEDEGGGGGSSGFGGVASQCKGMMFSEILSYYESSQSEQFVELYNMGVENVNLDGCSIRYKNKIYALSGMVGAEGYFVRLASDFKLTKNPATSNILELLDADGEVLDKLEYPNGQRRGTAYALIGYDEAGKEIWRVTYHPTPGEPNDYQEFKTCEAGKVLNEATGNCVKVTSVAEKICGEGQYLNILTGRCRKIPDDASGVKECKDGYYYNEETKRCRKIQDNKGADYALVPETFEEEPSFVALYLVLGVLIVGLVYIIYEFRNEILRVMRKVKWW